MKNYNDLDARGKFIRTVWFSAVCIVLFGLIWWFVTVKCTMSTGFFVKLVLGTVICAAVMVWQIVTTYRAWQKDKNDW